MLMLARRKCLVICISLVLVVLVATSCAPVATPTPTPPPTFTPTVVLIATPTVAPPAAPTSEMVATPTPIPTEAPTAAPTPEVVGTPTSPDEVPRITVEELKELMDSGADIVIVDAQPTSVYELGHIKGAVSIPWAPEIGGEEGEEGEGVWLPSGKPIITYCACGPGEADSADVALQLIRMGYKDVKVLADPAILGWIEAGYPME